ncbi:MAG TPA: GNAT family N-acetyltransferase [Acidimicrobiales bacterium]|nr:GNAT family N-acetyltransferase [Acidimicrobiales bacterium]
MTPDDVASLRATLEGEGPGSFRIDDLRADDLGHLDWSGSRAHLRSVARQLERIADGEAEYLVARGPDGTPVAKAGIDYGVARWRGVIWQVVVRAELQGLGLGTRLLEEAEARMRARGCRLAVLSVEVDNPRAQALYERLGYRGVGTRQTGWEVDGPGGAVDWYTTEVLDMEKPLPSTPG